MLQIMPTIRDLTRGATSSDTRSRIRLRFVSPLPRPLLADFHRLKLSGQMLAGGESKVIRHWATRRGVVKIELAPDWIVNPLDPPGMQLVTSCVLVMDRRYREEVLAAVYRTAGMIADDLGVRIK